MELDKRKLAELGLEGREPATTAAVARYTAGVVKRERERLARIFDRHGMDEIAAAIRSDEEDALVFKWMGPEEGLDEPPVPLEHKEQQEQHARDDFY